MTREQGGKAECRNERELSRERAREKEGKSGDHSPARQAQYQRQPDTERTGAELGEDQSTKGNERAHTILQRNAGLTL